MEIEKLKELLGIFEDTDLSEMELSMENMSVRFKREMQTMNTVTRKVAAEESMKEEETTEEELKEIEAVPVMETEESIEEDKEALVTAPLVGKFYLGSGEGQSPFVNIGDLINEGDSICSIEALNFMNEVPSTASGVVKEVLVKDGEFVEYGRPLFRIETE